MLKRTYRKYISWLESRSQAIRVKKQWIGEWIEVLYGNDKTLIRDTKLTLQEKREIQEYWKSTYGKKIPLNWHKRYYGYSGKLDKQYFPEILYTTKLEPLLNPDHISKVLQDKSLIEFLYAKVLDESKDLVIPKTVCGCANGYFYDENRCPMTEEAFREKLSCLDGDYVIKPTLGSSSGHDVELLIMEGGKCKNKDKDIEEIYQYYGKNFIIQEKIQQHKVYGALHPQSINTIRVLSYRKEGEIKTAPIIMRIGRGEHHIDGPHEGEGMYVAVSDDGVLGERAVDFWSKHYKEHPDTKINFAGYQLPFMRKIISYARQLHTCLPNMGFVNWDFSVNENNEVVLIEANLCCGSVWLIQNVWGKGVFGEDTEYMLHLIKNKR